jgi:hypothetical protein
MRSLVLQICCARALFCVLLTALSGTAFAQTSPAKPPPSQPGPSASEESYPGRCKPIGVTLSGENVFPFQCKRFIELQSAAKTKPASQEAKSAAEEKSTPADERSAAATDKPAPAEGNSAATVDRPAAAEEKPAVAGEPLVAEETTAKQSQGAAPGKSKPAVEPVGAVPLPKRAEITPGCTHFRSYDPVSGTYMARGHRHQCTTVFPAPSTKALEEMARGSAGALAERYDPLGDEMMAIELYRRLSQLEAVARNNADKTHSPPEDDADLLVAILMARLEITSISDLAGKSVAIDDKYSVSNGSVRIAIVAAGAPEVQLRENQTAAIDRLFSGDVPAAVLALVSARAADGFPEISGYRIFHIPLSPRSPEAPASDATVGIAR